MARNPAVLRGALSSEYPHSKATSSGGGGGCRFRYSKQRPAFSAVVFPLLHDQFTQNTQTSIPAKHFEEVTQFTSRVATLSTRTLQQTLLHHHHHHHGYGS